MPRFLLLAALAAILASGFPTPALAQQRAAPPATDAATFVRQHYRKLERQIAMRDGTRLFTVLYVPLDAAPARPYPFLLERTPYSAGPYGADNYRKTGPGPSAELSRERYIFVYQDVRGRYKSEGQFEEMTPARRAASGSPTPLAPANAAGRPAQAAHDESTDTYDTVEWLLKNVGGNNGRVGLIGISYPGFYATAALPDAHPAVRAVSPQAPVTDEFVGDDAFHKGAFFLLDNFDFMKDFDGPRRANGEDYRPVFKADYQDAYQFFLKLGPLKNANGPAYYNHKSRIFSEYLAHPTYDAYWQARNIRPALTGVKPAVLVVGGWFDAEDLFGALHTYQAIEKQSPGTSSRLVMGPWTHGAWARPDWSRFGPLSFGENTAQHFRDSLETPFFNFYLKDQGRFNPAEATVFNTGTNQWQTYPAWPPAAQPRTLFLQEGNRLAIVDPKSKNEGPMGLKSTPPNVQRVGADNSVKIPFRYRSDPASPVPYTSGVHAGRNNEYMVEDQRFATRRPDVLTFQTEPLTEDLTLAGPLTADLFVSTTGTDADFIVKLIDVLPAGPPGLKIRGGPAGGVQRLVRAEPIRGRFRNGFAQPEAFAPGRVVEVKYELNDVLHTFQKGHRLMVQVQSSWFPLIDRNPQTFVNIMQAEAGDFQPATISVYHDAAHPSGLLVPVLAP